MTEFYDAIKSPVTKEKYEIKEKVRLSSEAMSQRGRGSSAKRVKK